MKYRFVLLSLIAAGCLKDAKNMNELSRSTSPYLLQHAKNPVHWKEWSPASLQLAQDQDKPILVSIGYSSCHWCHVMEKESFEDSAIARLMNENFVNIKVDREERPDVDQLYMDAVQTMGLRGGWPLNVFLTPDQKPFYGGTYFPKEGWKNLLESITEAFTTKRDKITESAEAFAESLQVDEALKYKLKATDPIMSLDEQKLLYDGLQAKFDAIEGGISKAPKFPMPSIWQYLAMHYHLNGDTNALKQFSLTLEKMADGGIYDHIGGGFARYSTDGEWHVPHFEKMLYDNGQLLSLYATGYKLTQNEKFKEVINETASWLEREMLDENGGFYAALDADSEGEEGKYYVWSADELAQISGDDFEWLSTYFDIRPEGNWEGANVLRVRKSRLEIAHHYSISAEALHTRLTQFKMAALQAREKRPRPGLDYKQIAAWNGLALTGLCHAHQAIEAPTLLALAKKNARFIRDKLIKDDILYRFPDQKMEGFLEDYAAVIQALITCYETWQDRSDLALAKKLMNRVEQQFSEKGKPLYFFTSQGAPELIAKKKELFDNVIPASNSLIAWNLIHIGTHLYDDTLVEKGRKMVAHTKQLILQEAEYMSNWSLTALEISRPMAEIVIVGPEASAFSQQLNARYLPNKIISSSENPSELAPFTHKTMIEGQTTLYVCYDKTCKRPVTTCEDALAQLQ